MSKLNSKFSIFLSIYLLLTVFSAQTHAITLSQTPLFLSQGVKPNVMYILDDSSSMFSEVVPESLHRGGRNAVLVYPWARNVYHTTDDTWINNTERALPAMPGNIYGKVLRSKHNSLYYDPAKRYLPWVSTDGVNLMPQADATCALHNPMKTGTGENKCRNLTVAVTATSSRTFDTKTRSWLSCTNSTTCTTSTTNAAYFPATYFWYTGANTNAAIWTDANYAEERIDNNPAGETYTGHGRTAETRPDCTTASGVTTCTYAQEIQNFANWYTYYRSRILTARGGTGTAFSQLELEAMRVGYAQLNKDQTSIDGKNTTMIMQGVRNYTAGARTDFLELLYKTNIPQSGNTGYTPLRNALEAAGKYYQRNDTKSPWADDPALGQAADNHASCRQSNTILMTDGYWNNWVNYSNDAGNADGTPGMNVFNPATGNNQNTYAPTPPFQDNQANTLADVAMQYWKTDLRADLANKLTPTAKNPAFWQHMTTFTVSLGLDGTVSYPNAQITAGTFNSWPLLPTGDLNGQESAKADDLIHAAVNGRGEFFNVKDPETFATSLGDALKAISASAKEGSAAAAAANSTSLNSGSAIYTAKFNSTDWSGVLESMPLTVNGAFDASGKWTSSIPSASLRTILSYNATTSSGIVFDWANLSNDQKNSLAPGSAVALPALPDATAVVAGQARVNWVKGEKPEAADAAAYDLRSRTNLMGDIVNSDPAYAGNNDMGFSRLSATLGGDTYKNYVDTVKKNRREVIYVGANDGMLHGFNVKDSASGTSKAPGLEIFAYVPSQVYANLTKLMARNYGDAKNPHRYYVDGPATISDAYVNGSWKNVLVGTLGAGGKGIFVLDVTDPDAMTASKVLFELTDAKYPQLGNITGKAIVAPAADGRWKIFLGNGYNSTQGGSDSDKAYLGVIDINDEVNKVAAGSSRTRFIATNNTDNNALAQPALLAGGQGYVVAAYAGDLFGNLWKFDLSSTTADWGLAFGSSPLFTAIIGTVAQPITASPTLGFNSALDPARVMVYFGTGRYVTDTDNTPNSNIQSFYAIADKGAAVANTGGARSGLHVKSISSSSTTKKRIISGEVSGGAGAVPWPTVNGWYLDFPANERVITKPLLIFDRLIFPTIAPSDDVCNAGGSGWVMELIAVGDKNVSYSVLGDSANSKPDVPIYGALTSVEGPGKRDGDSSAGNSSSASSASNACGAGANSGKSGVVAIVGNDADGNAKGFVGGRPCDLYGRQSWRELE